MSLRFAVRLAVCVLGMLVLALQPVFAQRNPFEGKPVVRIEYVPSPQPLDPVISQTTWPSNKARRFMKPTWRRRSTGCLQPDTTKTFR